MSQGRVPLRAGGAHQRVGFGRTSWVYHGVAVWILAVLWVCVDARAQDDLPGNDPAAWLVEASVQARRVSGVGEELTDALQTKGALLATIAVHQHSLGQDAAAADNDKIVQLCIRALAHDGEDGWIHAARAKALREQGREAEAGEALGRIGHAGEQAAVAAWLNGEAEALTATRGVSPRFASRFAWAEARQTVRRDAATVARHGSVAGAQEWVSVLNDPAERAWASLGVAEGLLAAAADPPRDLSVYDPIEPLANTEVRAETQTPSESEAVPSPTDSAVTEATTVTPTIETEVKQTETAEAVQAQPEPVALAAPDGELQPEPEAGTEVSAPIEPVALSDEATAIGQEPSVETPAQSIESLHTLDVDLAATSAAEQKEFQDAVAPGPDSAVVHAGSVEVEAEQLEPLDLESTPQSKPQAVAVETESSPEAQASFTEAPESNETHPVPVVEQFLAAEETTTTLPDVVPVPEYDSQPDPVGDAVDSLTEVEAEPEPAIEPELPPTAAPVIPNLSTLADPLAVLDSEPAADVVDFEFTTTKGPFTVRVHRDWAPLAADRFHDLAAAGFYHNQRVFRVVPGFIVQWGIHGFPDVAAAWRPQMLTDEPRTQTNRRGTIAFAAATRPHTRTTQVFINLADNEFLDDLGFVPFGEVVEGMDVVGSLFGGYGETPSTQQREIQLRGNAFLDAEFPELDSILSVRVVGE